MSFSSEFFVVVVIGVTRQTLLSLNLLVICIDGFKENHRPQGHIRRSHKLAIHKI